jgi:hypothetical protein
MKRPIKFNPLRLLASLALFKSNSTGRYPSVRFSLNISWKVTRKRDRRIVDLRIYGSCWFRAFSKCNETCTVKMFFQIWVIDPHNCVVGYVRYSTPEYGIAFFVKEYFVRVMTYDITQGHSHSRLGTPGKMS